MQLLRFRQNVRQGRTAYFGMFGVLLWIVAIFGYGIWHVFDVRHFNDQTFAWLSLILTATIGFAGSVFIIYPVLRRASRQT